MYNGIGLLTPRGSGTNGFVQRNLSFIRPSKQKMEYRHEDIKPLAIHKGPHKDILDHQRKRQIELKVLTWAEDTNLYQSGKPDEEIESILSQKREEFAKLEQEDLSLNAANRSLLKEQESERFRQAFGIKDYQEGKAFAFEEKQKEKDNKKRTLEEALNPPRFLDRDVRRNDHRNNNNNNNNNNNSSDHAVTTSQREQFEFEENQDEKKKPSNKIKKNETK